MSAYQSNSILADAIRRRLGVDITPDQAGILRRAELTLHRWSELECGDGNCYASWAIERDDVTGKPFMCRYPHDGKSYRTAIPDREAGALRRVAALCKSVGLHYYHQGDPRGCQLYVSDKPMDCSMYTNGVCCSVK